MDVMGSDYSFFMGLAFLFPCFFLKFKISFAMGFNCSTFYGFFVFLSKSIGTPLPLSILILIIPTFSSAFEKPLPFLMNFTPLKATLDLRDKVQISCYRIFTLNSAT